MAVELACSELRLGFPHTTSVRARSRQISTTPGLSDQQKLQEPR